MSKRLVIGENARVGEWVADRVQQWASWGDFSAIGLEKDGEIVAGVVMNDFNGANASVHVAGTGKHWLNRDFLFACFDWWFNQLKLKRITGYVSSDNEAALQFDKALGFKEEFVMKDAHPDGDIIVMVMRREDCRWLERK